ncbi:uncharacterized protein LOC124118091 [Haliotis rufescens]|uniref:uncharacterized protein LOC124118091 n=1 Tax=Haliotis rufescens TaxID=6454 RepID=UPI00201F4E82|nr:uncharacterized protein LOC124118091 [Haliotis rufescens]
MADTCIAAIFTLYLSFCVSAFPFNANDEDSYNLDFIFGDPQSPSPKGDDTTDENSIFPSRGDLEWPLSLFPSDDFFNDIDLDNGFNDDENDLANQNTDSKIGGLGGGKDYHDNGNPYGGDSQSYDTSPVKLGYYDNSQTQSSPYPHLASPRVLLKEHVAKKCQPEFSFDFEGNRPFTERYNRIWMGREGNVFTHDGAAAFQGGHLFIPFFTGNDLRPAYRLTLLVKAKSSGSSNQAIVSNSFSRTSSTFSLALIGNKIQLVIIPRYGKEYRYKQTRKPVVLSLPINQGSFTYVSVEQDDVTVKLTVGDRAVYAYGRIPAVSNEPLYIGAGASALGYLDDYYGEIDSLVFDRCPRKITKGY